MKIPYRYITPAQACELALNGYELSMDADEQVVHILRRWPREETIQGNETEKPPSVPMGIDYI